MLTDVSHKIIAMLDEAGVDYKLLEHEETPTSADAARVRGTDPHSGAKALALRGNESGEDRLLVLPGDMKMNNKFLKKHFGESMSFMPDLVENIGVVPGSVPPFGSAMGLKTYCATSLADNETISFNVGSLTHSITMNYNDYIKLENPELLDFAVM